MTSLEHATHISVRTFRRTGEPVDTPVWHAVLDETVYLGSPAPTGKLARMDCAGWWDYHGAAITLAPRGRGQRRDEFSVSAASHNQGNAIRATATKVS